MSLRKKRDSCLSSEVVVVVAVLVGVLSLRKKDTQGLRIEFRGEAKKTKRIKCCSRILPLRPSCHSPTTYRRLVLLLVCHRSGKQPERREGLRIEQKSARGMN